jgi:outer membrane protein OmpA-like peptidoglycan-associated protein/tetratricopeptide (TPR) repeat protein
MKTPILKSTLFLLTTVLITFNSGYAQTKKSKTELSNATLDFKTLRYASAVQKLNKIIARDSSNITVQEMLAYSYKMLQNYDEALKWYEKLTQQKSLKPEWALFYAEALANNQKYERSEGWYRKYVTMMPADKRAAALAVANQSSFSKNTGNWKISFTNLNTISSDYSPAYYKEGLIFSSNRKKESLTKHVFQWDNSPFTNLYAVDKLSDIKEINRDSLMNIARKTSDSKYKFNDDDTAPTSNDTKNLGTFNTAIQRDSLQESLKSKTKIHLLKGSINTKYHEGTAAAFPDGSIIFTRNNYFKGHAQQGTDGINKLKLYTATGDKLSHVIEFPFNSNDYSTGHPTLNADGTLLIFASDMPGGFGGTDLYYCVRSGNGQWTRPINLGKKINTEGNEMFPQLDKDGILYFASTGLPGLGGLDIFQVQLKEMKPIEPPKNLGVPINSAKDDFGLIKSQDGKSGFFSSNRNGNDDIYQVKRAFQLMILEGQITDAKTHIPLAGSRLLMRHIDGIDTIKTNLRGEFRREMPRETDFATTAQKPGYVNKIGFLSSSGITKDSVIRMNITLNKTENVQQYVLNHCDSLKKVFAIKNIFYDLDRSEIRFDARPALDELVLLMRKYPEITVISSSHCDSRASEEYNRQLSLRRGESAKNYLIAKGIKPSRLNVEYYGKTRLINRCFDGIPCSEADQQLNRRTEFDIIINGINITQQSCND